MTEYYSESYEGQRQMSETFYVQTDNDLICLKYLCVNLDGPPQLSEKPWKGN